MECCDGVASSDLFHGEAEGRDLGSLAAWRVDDFYRAVIRSELIIDLSAFGADGRYSSSPEAKVAARDDSGGARGGLPKSESRAVLAVHCKTAAAAAVDNQS